MATLLFLFKWITFRFWQVVVSDKLRPHLLEPHIDVQMMYEWIYSNQDRNLIRSL